MQKWNIHTPEGIQDIVFPECFRKREIEMAMRFLFQKRGFIEIEPPIIEFFDVFNSETLGIEQESMFKFLDHKGRILVLRPDITTSAARIVSTKFAEKELPARLSYIGNVYRFNETGASAFKQREFTQAGIEIFGHRGPSADAEIISTMIEAILCTGLEKFQIEIGQIAFFKGLMGQAGFSENEIESVRILIENKDSLGIELALREKKIEPELRELIIKLPELFGSIDIIDSVIEKVNDGPAKDALRNLKEVCEILCEYEYEKYISVDLGMVQSINYYTGIVFKGLAHGIGFPICGGGRYDKLTAEFDKDIPATGGAIGINRLISALDRQNVEIEICRSDTLVGYSSEGRKTAIKLSKELRRQGVFVELSLEMGTKDGLIDYAKNTKMKGIVFVKSENDIELYEVESGKSHKTSFEELLRG